MVLYLAVKCRADGCHDNPEHFIPLRLVACDDDLRNVASAPFVAACSAYGNSRQYEALEVTTWKGPEPIGKFQTHPAFL